MPLDHHSKTRKTKKSKRKSQSIDRAYQNNTLDSQIKPWNGRANLYVSDGTGLPGIMVGKYHNSNENTIEVPTGIALSPVPQTHNSDNESIVPIVAPIVALVVIVIAACIFYAFRNKKIKRDARSDIDDKDGYENDFDHKNERSSVDRLFLPRLGHHNNSHLSLNFPLPPQAVVQDSRGNNELKEENASVYYESLEYQDSRSSNIQHQTSPISKPATILTSYPSVQTEALSSPNMAGNSSRVSSVILMTAKRQHLHHALPTVLSHLTDQ